METRGSGGTPAPDPARALEALLLDVMRWLAPATASSHDLAQARTWLARLPPQALFDADERMRTRVSPLYGRWPADALDRIASAALDPASRQSLLFLSAAHVDGRIRQATLLRLPEFPGDLALAAALIRCADWAEPVRRAAQASTERLLTLCHGDDVVALWPLVLRLGTRERVSQAWFRTRIEGWVLAVEARPWLRALLDSERAPVRRWALRRCLEEDIRFETDLLDRAIRDPDPGIGLHALRHARQAGDPARMRQVAETGLRARHPVIRRESLRVLCALGALARAQLLAALCDGSAGVRSLAAFVLRDRDGEDPEATWRAVLDADGARPTLGALVALAERAQAQDAARMRRWLRHPGGHVRAAALRGLVKAGCRLDDAELAALLAQGGTRVMRRLQGVVAAGDLALDLERIGALVSSPALGTAARRNLRRLVAALGHWHWLALLLNFSARDAAGRAWWRDAIPDWIAESGAYAPLGAGMRHALLRLLEGRRADLRVHEYETIRAAIERH